MHTHPKRSIPKVLTPATVAHAETRELAAVDLGSNSFHMLVARCEGGMIKAIARDRETVRLAAGLTECGDIDDSTRIRALDCLHRFRQKLQHIPTHHVQAVGTETLRQLRTGSFLAQAERTLNHEIRIISGQDEARLVYAGVCGALDESAGRRHLIVDIGGGSTELALGQGQQVEAAQSVQIGCVGWTQHFFPGGVLNTQRMDEARRAARMRFESPFDAAGQPYGGPQWNLAVGCSGTIRGVWHVLKAQGWAEDTISRSALNKLTEQVAASASIKNIRFPALREDRRPVFAGGLAILAGVFDALKLEAMHTSPRALREGLVQELADGFMRHQANEAARRPLI